MARYSVTQIQQQLNQLLLLLPAASRCCTSQELFLHVKAAGRSLRILWSRGVFHVLTFYVDNRVTVFQTKWHSVLYTLFTSKIERRCQAMDGGSMGGGSSGSIATKSTCPKRDPTLHVVASHTGRSFPVELVSSSRSYNRGLAADHETAAANNVVWCCCCITRAPRHQAINDFCHLSARRRRKF